MGIRIHKFMGYGLTDVKSRKYRIADGRINRNCVLLDDYEAQYKTEYRDEYLAWLRKQNEKRKNDEDYRRINMLDAWFDKKNKYESKRTMGDCIAYQNEYGLKNVLVLQPLACHDWYRHDDAIDYVTATYLEGPEQTGNKVDVLDHGIYPFNGSYMDSRDGNRLDDRIMPWIRIYHYYKDDPEKLDDMAPVLDQYAQAVGFNDSLEAALHVAPQVPTEIQDLCEFTQIFKKPETVLQLRPMLYTYWC